MKMLALFIYTEVFQNRIFADTSAKVQRHLSPETSLKSWFFQLTVSNPAMEVNSR
jgi:hypothetical protein